MNPMKDKVQAALATFLPTGTRTVRMTDIVFENNWSDLLLVKNNVIRTEEGLTFFLFIPPCDLPINRTYFHQASRIDKIGIVNS